MGPFILSHDENPWTHGDAHIAAKEGEPFGEVEILTELRDLDGNLIALLTVDDPNRPGGIVRAVNSYADLLAACRAAVRCLESIERNETALIAAGNPATTSTIAGWKRNLEHARAAIAKADGQAVTA